LLKNNKNGDILRKGELAGVMLKNGGNFSLARLTAAIA
jgi:hypothetical protein